MTNQLTNKSKTLLDLLNKSGLTKEAAQEITHKTLLDQTNLGKEQTKDLHDGVEGTLADTDAAKNTSTDTVPDLPGVQNLNASGEEGLRERGSSVETQTTDGEDAGTPAQEAKKMATDYRAAVAAIVAQQRKAQDKKASAENPTEAPAEPEFTTGTAVMAKFAALTQNSTEADIADAKAELLKLASTNQAFNVIRERIMMQKMAEDIQALAEAEGISPEEAAAELQAAADADPAMGDELESEASGEAVVDLANAEAATGDLMAGIDEMAANASANLGVEVTADDIMQAADEVVAQAEEMGVEPEALLQAAIEEMQGGEGDISEEDMAAADEILSQAAAQGISPEEVIQALSSDLEGVQEAAPAEEAAAVEEAPAEAPAEEATEAPATEETPAEESKEETAEGSEDKEDEKEDDDKEKDESEPAEKVASVQQKRASTDRAAYVQYLRHLKK